MPTGHYEGCLEVRAYGPAPRSSGSRPHPSPSGGNRVELVALTLEERTELAMTRTYRSQNRSDSSDGEVGFSPTSSPTSAVKQEGSNAEGVESTQGASGASKDEADRPRRR